MDPVTAITIAKGIAKYTGLGDWIKNKLGEKLGEKTAQKITHIAQVATNSATPEEALERVKLYQDEAEAVKQKLLEKEHELKLAYLEDVQSAREMYGHKNAMADKVAEQVISQNHKVVALLLLCNVLVLQYVEDTAVAMALGNLIGGSVTALWQERQQVIGFFFGSSLGSKLKNAFPLNTGKKQ